MSESSTEDKSIKKMIVHFVIMLLAAFAVGGGGVYSGVLEVHQATACGVFIAIIFGTLFFWEFRLAIAFLGIAALIFTNSLDVPHFITSSSLDVILFLVGMMIIVGALKDLGFFTWIVQRIVSMPNLSGAKFVFVTATASALLACAVDEVTSIIFISTLIFQVCDRLKISPKPYILIAVLATNVGSSGTMMGNPVGIYIGTKGSLTFGDFMVWAFPLMLLSLLAVICLLLLVYRKELKNFDVQLKNRLDQGLSIAPVVDVPYKAGLTLLILTVCAIASHHQLEEALHLSKNSVLIVAPMICAGVVMIIKSKRARNYVNEEVDWWTLLFFMLLFAVAGTLHFTHVDQVIATSFSKICGTSTTVLVPFIFGVSAVGSAFIDNVIFVAAFCPVIEELSITLKDFPLWWALLFGACFGGNITMIGSTANIVALGMMEKRGGEKVTFFQWLRIGLLATILSGAIVIGGLLITSSFMPDRAKEIEFESLNKAAGRNFANKRVAVIGELHIKGKGEELVEKFQGVIDKNKQPKPYYSLKNRNGKGAIELTIKGCDMSKFASDDIVRVEGVVNTIESNDAYPVTFIIDKITKAKTK